MNQVPILLHRLVRNLDRTGDRILKAALGLSMSRALVLLAIDVDGPMTQRDLASWVGSTAPAVTSLLRELRADGLVSIREDEDNRRRKVVSLTAEGRRTIRSARRLLDQRFDELLRRAGIDGDKLLDAVARLADTVEEVGR